MRVGGGGKGKRIEDKKGPEEKEVRRVYIHFLIIFNYFYFLFFIMRALQLWAWRKVMKIGDTMTYVELADRLAPMMT